MEVKQKIVNRENIGIGQNIVKQRVQRGKQKIVKQKIVKQRVYRLNRKQ